ncbi:MAG: GNAT family N-acetyltransferase [Chitinophaga sp.]|uniref:GNAT family N-acetyltransferase n=1 Tax=Chitinophaga sp. TaxID=1869181 RepID=UPI0025BD8928|nr:GNAT family N-acetyltransferase [Chitinophaga sp.]MBV8253088.1 GNAT family N-acetyltransferase [Chitinophaga sp.]
MHDEHFNPLDNPVWHSLQTIQRYFAHGTENVQRYAADVLPFMGYDPEKFTGLEEIAPWISPAGEALFIVGELPVLPEKWDVINELVCSQMVCETKPEEIPHNEEIILLTEADREEMVNFVNEGQPGYFLAQTPSLGDYYGIRKHGKLVALAGQRMRMPGLTEVSAVVTHKDHRGKGYAGILTRHVAREIFEAGDIPFLHVLHNNQTAISIYERIGFAVRRAISFWKIAVK